jgi:RNA polymerase sigma-70 factor (ECF subfamily)
VISDPASLIADLYRDFSGKIFTYIYRRVSCPELAEDLCQEVFAKMLDALRRGVEVRHNGGFLHRIAHNLIIDWYRERDQRQTSSLDSMLASATLNMTHTNDQWTPDVEALPLMVDPSDLEVDTIDRLDRAETLRRAGGAMTALQATVIQLRYFDGYGFDEIAAQMDRTPGAVKILKARAVDNMRVRVAA